MAKHQAASATPTFRLIPLPEVPDRRTTGRRGPLAIALEDAYKKKQAVVIVLGNHPLSHYSGSLSSMFKKDGLRLRARTASGDGYLWLEPLKEAKK